MPYIDFPNKTPKSEPFKSTSLYSPGPAPLSSARTYDHIPPSILALPWEDKGGDGGEGSSFRLSEVSTKEEHGDSIIRINISLCLF